MISMLNAGFNLKAVNDDREPRQKFKLVAWDILSYAHLSPAWREDVI